MNSQNILIVSDSPLFFSGVGNQVKHICKRLFKNGHKVFNIGVLRLDASKLPPPALHTFDTGEEIRIIHHNKYDDIAFIDKLIKQENINCVVLFTDPNKYYGLWANANYFHAKNIPIYYVSVWDTYLVPKDNGQEHFNLPIYENCDAIGCISKQTKWFTDKVFEKLKYSKKPFVDYVGHGSDYNTFQPLSKEVTSELYKKLFGTKEYKFIVMMANKNQLRKKFPDLIEAWTIFMDKLTPEQREECALVLHTEAVSEFGTDLPAVVAALAPNYNVFLSTDKVDEITLAKLYNIADVVCNVSNAEGFGLTTNEALLCGTPIIANATGGLVDQIGFFQDGLPVKWSPEFRQNLQSYGHGTWSYPLPNNRTIIGTGPTPYLYDENCSMEDIAKGLDFWYNTPAQERERVGLKGREWCQMMGLNAKDFSIAVVEGIENLITNYTSRSIFNTYKA